MGASTGYTLASSVHTLGYDNASRITRQSSENILAPTLTDHAETYTIAPASNPMTQVSGSRSATFQYDANSLNSNGQQTFVCDDARAPGRCTGQTIAALHVLSVRRATRLRASPVSPP
ncbi:MAG: hypothetical protein U1F68_11015 [Gammaproteobacteria bacterium]